MILFRADANPKIGTGHVMRCLSLADALRDRGRTAVFVLAEPYFQAVIQARGYHCTILQTDHSRLEEELPVFLPLLEREQPALVILDSYFVTAEYLRAVKHMAPLLYIDDLNAFDYPADIVVNYNIFGPETAYPENKTYLLGPQYAPLRKEFQGLEKRVVKERVEHVLVSTGGTDPYHTALRCVGYLRKHPISSELTYHFVLGAMNQDIEEIQKAAAGVPGIELHCQVTDMRTWMLQCDAALSAAGTTLYELCACGLPTVTYILADNQIPGAAAFQKVGLMPCAGDIRSNPTFEEQLMTQLQLLMSDRERRRRVAQQMQEVVDGNGAGRFAEMICGSF